ncbi:DUF5412 family protein [Pradoshia sp.]
MPITTLKKEGNRRLKQTIRVFLVSGLLLTGVITYGVYWAFFDMNRLPKGEFLTEKASPGGLYMLRAYRVNEGATTSYAVLGELVFNESSKTKNIYWKDREDTANITWTDRLGFSFSLIPTFFQ